MTKDEKALGAGLTALSGGIVIVMAGIILSDALAKDVEEKRISLQPVRDAAHEFNKFQNPLSFLSFEPLTKIEKPKVEQVAELSSEVPARQ